LRSSAYELCQSWAAWDPYDACQCPIHASRSGGCAKAPRVLVMGQTLHLSVAQKRTRTRSHGSDQSRAITLAAPLSCPQSSPSPRGLRSALAAGPTPRRGSSPPPPALEAGAATLRDSLGGAPAPFCAFFNDRGRTHGQPPRRIAHATRIHHPIDNLWLDLRRETGVGRYQAKRPSTAETARTTPIAWLAFRRRAVSHDSRGLTVGTTEHWRYHLAGSHTDGAVPFKHPARIADQQL